MAPGGVLLFKLPNVFVQIVMEFSCADCAVLPRIMELREAVGKTVFK